MRSIKRRFEKLEKERPNHSTYINFATAIKEQNFKRSAIRRWFNKLVDKGDYIQPEKRAILKHLYLLTKPREDNHIRG